MKTEEQEKNDSRKWFKIFVIGPRFVGITPYGALVYASYRNIEFRMGSKKGYIDSRIPGTNFFGTQFRGGS